MEHELVQLARKTIETYIKEDKTISPPENLTEEMKQQAGVFVSLHKGGELRGCIGTFSPTHNNVAEEIIHNAISAATQDPRFSPVEEDELKDLEISVDVLSTPEAIKGVEELDPKKYGIIVSKDGMKGLLLPDLEGVNTVLEQINIAMQKAGIYNSTGIEILKFEVKRYH